MIKFHFKHFEPQRHAIVMLSLFAGLCCGAADVVAEEENDVQAAQAPHSSAASTAADVNRGVRLSPKAFRAAGKRIESSLVRIEGFGGVAGSAGAAGFQPPGEGATTGLILSSDGYIVTSTFNFLRKPPVITVVLPSGERKVATLLGRDETRRICLLKVDGVQNLAVPELLPHDSVKVGQWSVAVGVGFGGKQAALSAGIVSATHRISNKAIQTDANLSPANYGGPLLDLEGRVIGLCVPLSPEQGGEASGAEWYDSGIGFAVPLAENAERIEAMKQGRVFHLSWLGVEAKPFGEPPQGARVEEVAADSPAAAAGVQKEDKLLAIDGEAILDVTHLASVLHRYVADDKVTIRLQRGDATQELQVVLGQAPAKPKPAKAAVPPVEPMPMPPPK